VWHTSRPLGALKGKPDCALGECLEEFFQCLLWLHISMLVVVVWLLSTQPSGGGGESSQRVADTGTSWHVDHWILHAAVVL
jgi:hypothetical protein